VAASQEEILPKNTEKTPPVRGFSWKPSRLPESDRINMTDIRLEASIIFDPYRPEALRRNLDFMP